jgi:hypothetical protein
VSRLLLVDDPDAPFGRRLDPERVVGELDEVWPADERAVTLVEASDLSRVAAYEPRATVEQARRLRATALADADALLGRLLERVDPAHDAVLVFSPVSAEGAPALGIAALDAPGIDGGKLASATTRREGYVQLADITPTLLSLVGAEVPDEIEGRTFQVVGHAGDAHRIDDLADAADAAGLRDRVLPWAVVGIIAVLVVLTAGVVLRSRLAPALRGLLAPLALTCLGFVPATFLAAHVGPAPTSTLGYLAAIVVIAVLLGAAFTLIERRSPRAGALAAVGAIVGLVAVDVVVGAPLQINSIFGYSVAVGGRFAGVGNLAFALFGAATIVLAAQIVDRRGRSGRALAVGLLVAVVLLEGVPMLGADVGGVLSMVPAFGVTALLLLDRRIGVRELVGLGAVTGLAVLVFAFIDAARPDRAQTHLARLAQHVVDNRWGPFFDSLTRRWQASFGGTDLAGWVMVTGILGATALYVALVMLRQAGPRGPVRHRPFVAAGAGLCVLALVGLVANDSSVAVPTTMLIVVAPVVALRILAADAAAVARRGATPGATGATGAAGAAGPGRVGASGRPTTKALV